MIDFGPEPPADPVFLLEDGAKRYALVSFLQLLLEMQYDGAPQATINQGKWWQKNLERYMRDGSLPNRKTPAA